MKLPPDVRLQADLGLLLWKPRGVLDEKLVNKIIAFIREEEALSDANELRFIDTTAVTAVELNFRYVFRVALYRRLSRTGRPKLKSAFWVRDQAFAHYFKLHALLTDHSPLQARIFEEREAAAKWLGVPADLLETPWKGGFGEIGRGRPTILQSAPRARPSGFLESSKRFLRLCSRNVES
jgi:hypothetical protein